MCFLFFLNLNQNICADLGKGGGGSNIFQGGGGGGQIAYSL